MTARQVSDVGADVEDLVQLVTVLLGRRRRPRLLFEAEESGY